MPYKEPPSKITELFADEKGPGIWTAAFNSAYEKYQDDAKASKIAWGAVENAGYEKGKDGKWRKSKTKGVGMSLKEKVIAALNDLATKLEGEAEESPPAEPKVVAAAAEKPAEVPPEVMARLDELDKQVKSQAVELQMAGARERAMELCQRAHLAPKFAAPVAEYLAGKPEITLAEPTLDKEGKVAKEYKVSREEFFDRLITAKGISKLEEPVVLSEPPAKPSVETPFGLKGSMAIDEVKLAALADEADKLARAEGIPVNEAMKKVLAAKAKEGE